MRTHSAMSPSSLRRRELCPGSYRMEKDLPSTTSEAAELGSNQHTIAEKEVGEHFKLPWAELLTEDISAAKMKQEDRDLAILAAQQSIELHWPAAKVLIEHDIDLKYLHPSIGHGTADLIFVEDYDKAIVIDFKFGRGGVGNVENNLQLACYADGIKREFDCQAVEVCVIQPAIGILDRASLDGKTVGRAVNAASVALNPFAQLIPSAEACQYCKAAGTCPAQMGIVKKAPENIPAVTKENVTALAMGTISEFLAEWDDKNIEDIIGAMRQRLFEAVLTGYSDDNWQLGKGRNSRAWLDGAVPVLAELVKSKGLAEKDIWTEPELKSVAQIEALVGKSKSVKAAMADVVVVNEGKPKLERVAKHA